MGSCKICCGKHCSFSLFGVVLLVTASLVLQTSTIFIPWQHIGSYDPTLIKKLDGFQLMMSFPLWAELLPRRTQMDLLGQAWSPDMDHGLPSTKVKTRRGFLYTCSSGFPCYSLYDKVRICSNSVRGFKSTKS